MKKILKRVTAMCCATIIAASTMAMSAGAENPTAKGIIKYYSIQGVSRCSRTSAYGRTSTGAPTVPYVNSTYVYINTSSLKVVTQKKSSCKAKYSNTVNFSAPAGCRSIQVSSKHSAEYKGASWSDYTLDVY